VNLIEARQQSSSAEAITLHTNDNASAESLLRVLAVLHNSLSYRSFVLLEEEEQPIPSALKTAFILRRNGWLLARSLVENESLNS
jgi:hypothetical protein